MRHVPSWVTTALESFGVMLVLVLSLPLLALAVVLLRTMLLVAALAVVVGGAVLLGCVPRFRRCVGRLLGERPLWLIPAGRGRH